MSESAGTLRADIRCRPDSFDRLGNRCRQRFCIKASARVATGFSCSYDFGFVETTLLGMIMKGLLVLAQLHRFKDESSRADYFVREYYALAHEQYSKVLEAYPIHDAVVIMIPVRFRNLKISSTSTPRHTCLYWNFRLCFAEHPHIFHINMPDIYCPISACAKS